MARPAPAVLAHRSAPAGLAAPEGAALLDPKAALTWLSPPVPLAPSRSPPEGDRAGFALRCPLAARRRPRCTGDRTARRRSDRVPGPTPGPKTERTSCPEAGDSLPGGRCPWCGIGCPTLLPLTELDSSFRVYTPSSRSGIGSASPASTLASRPGPRRIPRGCFPAWIQTGALPS